MGATFKRCSDIEVQKGLGAEKPLDASSSEEELEEDEEESEIEEDNSEEEKSEVAAALTDVLKRGRTATFKEAIAHASSLGLDEEKIKKAELRLEQHKYQRQKEIFETELREFLDKDKDAIDLQSVIDMRTKAKEFGCAQDLIAPLDALHDQLDLGRELGESEVDKAREILECLTRSFVSQCVSTKGRAVTWVDLDAGKKQKAIAKLDLTLKNFRVYVADEEFVCKLGELTCTRALDADVDLGAFDQLKEDDRQNAVCLIGSGIPESDWPWCFVESDQWGQDEFLCGMMVLNGPLGGNVLPKRRNKDKKKDTDPASPRTKKSEKEKKSDKKSDKKIVEEQAEEAEGKRKDKRRSSLQKLQTVGKLAGKMALMKKGPAAEVEADENGAAE